MANVGHNYQSQRPLFELIMLMLWVRILLFTVLIECTSLL